MNVKLKVLLGLGFLTIMSLGGYFTYSALNQGIMFSYIQNLSVQGLDTNIIFDYSVLLLLKTIAAFTMYSFMIVTIFIVVTPLIILSPIKL